MTGSLERAAHFLGVRSTQLQTPTPRRVYEVPECSPGTLTLISGPSGAGKTSLLRAIRFGLHRRFIDVQRIDLARVRLLDLTPGDLERWMSDLAQVGLADWTAWQLRPDQLSQGQQFRVRLAIAIRNARPADTGAPRAPGVILCDEFASTLDRVSASGVSRTLRRCIDRDPRLTAVVATCHDDLIRSLRADVWVRMGETPGR